MNKQYLKIVKTERYKDPAGDIMKLYFKPMFAVLNKAGNHVEADFHSLREARNYLKEREQKGSGK